MKRFIPVAVAAVIIGASVAFGVFREYKNPDPNHTHADFAVWVNGQQLDFTDEIYMSGEYVEGEGTKRDPNPMRTYLHLHDEIGHVVHRHKPGLTIGDFFASLGLPMEGQCMTLDTLQYNALDAGWKEDFAVEPRLCTNGKFHWTMIVNGTEMPFNPAYDFADGDKILLVYSAGDMHDEQMDEMTNDACLYSKTCPWRGDPPAENCIADPTVPCVVQ